MKTWSYVKRLPKTVLTGLCMISAGGVSYYYFRDKKVSVKYDSKDLPPKSHTKWDENWDRRHGKDDEMYQPKVARNIILIRHGQYNMKGKSDEEKVLTELGRLQAEYTGRRLTELNIPWRVMIKSTMTRAQETGSIISQFLPKVPIEDCNFIREGEPIGPEPPSRGGRKPEASYYKDGARIEAGFRKYFHRADAGDEHHQYILIVCHANVIRYFVCRALQFPAEGWLRISLPHASITCVSIMPSGKCVLRCLGETGHMPPNTVTTR